MSLQNKRIIFIAALLFIIFSGPYTVLKNTDISSIEIGSIGFYGVLQRMFGLLGFSLIFIQIITGALMKKLWVQILGAFCFSLHITLGILTFLVILLHPLMHYIMGIKLGVLSDLIFLDLSNQYNIYVSIGIFAFILLLLTVTAGYFRTKPMFRRIWRKIHFLNYLIYMLIVIHASGIGSDFMSYPFVLVYYVSVPLVIASLGHRVYSLYQAYGVN